MKAISLWQPWASLWLTDRKIHETRGRRTSHRGMLLVHAAQRFERDVEDDLRAILEDEFGGHWSMDLPTGALIGVVELVDCRRAEDIIREEGGFAFTRTDDWHCGNFAPGRYGWKRGRFHSFTRPIPFRGKQGIITVPDDLDLPELPQWGLEDLAGGLRPPGPLPMMKG